MSEQLLQRGVLRCLLVPFQHRQYSPFHVPCLAELTNDERARIVELRHLASFGSQGASSFQPPSHET
jgi:hypothetical protein